MQLAWYDARGERQQAVTCACREAELEQLQVQLEDAGTNSGRISGLEAELTAAMAQVAAKVCTGDPPLHANQLAWPQFHNLHSPCEQRSVSFRKFVSPPFG